MTLVLKTIKNQKNIFVFIKLILFSGVLYVLYGQLRAVDGDSWESFRFERPFSFFLTVILVIPNIWFSYVKWKLTLKTIGAYKERQSAIQSFFAGIVTGMLTPNMLGNFIGRAYYFERSHRVQIVTFTMLSNFAQFIASITFGCVAILMLGELLVWPENRNIVLWLLLVVFVSYLMYFFVEVFSGSFKKRAYWQDFKQTLRSNRRYRSQLLLLSFARFAIFTLQFSLILHAFGEDFNLVTVAAIWQVYLITMIAPSLFLGKIGVKETIALS